jgi:hypothetical protein
VPPGPLKRFARTLAKPLSGPIDGRVGDINRRIGEVNQNVQGTSGRLDDLEHVVGANVATVVESSSYVGVELRRVNDELAALRDHVDEHLARLTERSYAERLARDAKAPLSQLDPTLASAINYANGHVGFAAQAGMWFNPPITVELGEGGARIGQVNERIVELPFAFGMLARLAPGARVLDVGGAESSFSLSAASLGYEVTVVDPRPLPFEHPRLTAVIARLDQWDPPDEPFDAAFFISTIEHIGLGAYGEGGSAGGAPQAGRGADREALAKVAGLLSPEGFLVLTVPYGRASVNELERVYDGERLGRLLNGWNVLEERVAFCPREKVWTTGPPSGEEDGVAMLLARPDGQAGPVSGA